MILSMQVASVLHLKASCLYSSFHSIEICYKYLLYNTDPIYKLLSSKEKLFLEEGGERSKRTVL